MIIHTGYMENLAGGAFQEQSSTVAIPVNLTRGKHKISRQLCNLN
jgi:hypothetical protein